MSRPHPTVSDPPTLAERRLAQVREQLLAWDESPNLETVVRAAQWIKTHRFRIARLLIVVVAERDQAVRQAEDLQRQLDQHPPTFKLMPQPLKEQVP